MKTLSFYIGIFVFLLCASSVRAASEAEFRVLSKHYTLHADGSQELRVKKELTLYTHAAMNGLYGETFITYDPQYQELKIHESYTRQKDGTIVKTPDNAFVEVLPSSAKDAPAYNRLKEMVVVHTGLELGATIVLDYSIVSRAGYLPALDVCCPVRELSPIKEFTCTVEVPSGVELHAELLNSSVRPQKTDTGNGKVCWQWKLKNVEPRPYAYPSYYIKGMSTVQQVASGMMPVVVASTYPSYTDALKNLREQFALGDEAAVKAKAVELTKDAGNDRQKKRDAIGQYMMLMYSRLATVGVSLQEAGYRLRPASEVIRSGYGTQAELVNLDVALQRAAGLNAEVVVCRLQSDAMGLSGIVSVFAKSELMASKVPQQGLEETALKDYMTVTDLQGNPVELTSSPSSSITSYTFKADDKRIRTLPNGYRVATAEGRNPAFGIFYLYATNTSVPANILLPQKYNHTVETTVELPAGMTWMKKTDKEVTNAFGKIAFKYAEADGKVKVTCTFVIDKLLVTPADYKEFYALMSELKDENNYTLVFISPDSMD